MLVSPEGAPLDARFVDALAGHTAYAQAGTPVSAAKEIGHVVKMTGSASIVRNGVAIVANTGDTLYQNDVVQTGSNSTMGMVLDDGSAFNLSANARCMLNDLVYDPAGSSNKSLFTLVQGAVSFVAGQVAPTGDMEVATPVAVIGIRGTAVLLDIGSTDGTVAISVADQQDGSVHSVQVFRCAPTNVPGVCTAGDQIGTVTSNGSALSITPGANLQISTQEISKTPAQVTQEFSAFQQVLSTYDAGKQLYPNLPQHTENLNHDNNPTPNATRTAVGSATILPSEPPTTTVFDNATTRAVADSGGDSTSQAAASAVSGGVGSGSITPPSQTLSSDTSQIVFVKETAPPPAPVEIITAGGQINQAFQTITGTVDPTYAGTTVAILDTYDGVTTTIGTVTVGTGGTWRASVTLTGPGSHSIVAQDAAANSTSAPVVFTLNTTAPAAPTITDAADIGGTVNAANDTASQALSGVAAAGSTVKIYLDGATTPTYTTTADPTTGAWSKTIGTLADGSYSYTATATDAAGNTSAPSAALAFVVATTAPAAPTITDAADIGGTVNAANDTASQALSGVAAAGSTVKIYLDGATTPTYTTTADPTTGAWSKTIGTLADGSYSYTATATDAAGNTSAPSAALAFVVATTAPAAPTITDAADIGGTVNAANDTASQALSGVAAAGSTVKIYLDGATTPTYTTTADPTTGAWSKTIGTLADGSYSYTATATDAAGNTSAPSAALAFVVATTAPAAPTITDAADIGGTVNAANDTASQALSGVAAAGSTVKIYLDGATTPTYTTTADPTTGAWSKTIGTLADGSYSYTATATDAAGNTSAPSAALAFVVATTAPAAPTITDAADIGGTVNAANDTASQALSGVAAAGSTVKIYLDGATTPTYTTTADPTTGAWSKTIGTLADGSYSYTATATDAAGNTSAPSAALAFVVATTAPAAPTITDAADIGGTVNAANDTASQALSGVAAAGSTVKIYLDGATTPTYTTTADPTTGAWSKTIGTLADGSYSYTATATDAAGNTSAPSAALAFVVATTAPAAPTITDAADIGGTVNAANDTASQALSGVAAAGSTVKIYLDGATTPTYTTTADPTTGAWSKTIGTLADGSYSYTATATDAAGNTSAPSAALAFVVATTAPAAPTITDAADIGGTVNAANDTASQALSGVAAAGSTVKIYLDGATTPTYTTTADPTTGAWSKTIGTLADGSYSYTATATDAAGNTSAPSAALAFVVATTAPAAPTITDAADIGGTVNAANDTASQALSGVAAAGSTVKIYLDGATTPTYTTTADPTTGAWSKTIGTLADGSYSYTATATDAAGNTSAPSAALAFVVATTAPAAPTITDAADIGGTVNAANDTASQALSGVAAAGSTVKIYLDGATTPTYTTTADPTTGAWSKTIGTLADGSYSYTATATDAAGNTSAPSAALAFVVATTAPAAPTITDAADIGGTVNAANDTASQALSGVAAAGSTVKIYLDGATTPTYTTTADPTTGAWSKTIGTLADGSYSYTATATDAAGNTSAPSAALAFVVATTAPAAPTITDAADIGGTVNAANDTASQALSGVAAAGSTVKIYLDGATTPTYTTTADPTTGAWSKTIGTLADGSYSYTATATDAAGNTSAPSAALAFVVATTAPAAPTITDAADIGGTVNAANDTASQALSGVAAAGSTVKIYLDGATTPTYTTTADPTTGAWSKTIGTLADGSYSYTATATDAAGNTSAPSAALAFVVATTAPAAPTITDAADIGGTVNAANDTASQALSGVAAAGSTVKIYLDGATTPTYTTTADPTTGAWSKTIGTLADGSYSYTATATDAAGNTSAPSAALAFVVATTAPAAPTITDAADIGGTVNAANDTASQALSGVAAAGSTVKIYLDGATTPTYTTTADPTTGAWSKTIGTLADGSYSYTATATDAAGNTSAPSAALAFVVATTAPAAPTITDAADIGGTVNAANDTASQALSAWRRPAAR